MLKKVNQHSNGLVKMRKPRVFLASSVEGLDVASAINESLDYDTEIVHWKDGFSLSSYTIDSLMEKARTVDFAIFVFTPDDVSTIREQSHIVVRDNVLFELGLFIGSLTKERCFIIKPRGVNLHFPTDLLGLTPADFDGNRSDNDLTQAVNAACSKVKKEILRLKEGMGSLCFFPYFFVFFWKSLQFIYYRPWTGQTIKSRGRSVLNTRLFVVICKHKSKIGGTHAIKNYTR